MWFAGGWKVFLAYRRRSGCSAVVVLGTLWRSFRGSVAERHVTVCLEARCRTPNSLQGAALVQGAMFVVRMRERFPEVGVTETHPKALLVALGLEAEGAFFQDTMFGRLAVQDIGSTSATP